jgi:hypothetical protein
MQTTFEEGQAELGNLIEAANKVAGQGSRKSPALMVLKKSSWRLRR